MTWKVERWLAEVFPGETEIYSAYRHLPPREFAIVSAAVIDAALAEVIYLRLAKQDLEKELESFLGLDGDGRAPVASFGSRIQLGLLLGILTLEDAEILKLIKNIRNDFAHRVNVTFLSPSIVKLTLKMHSIWLAKTQRLFDAKLMSGSTSSLHSLGQHLGKIPDAGHGLLLAVFTVYQAYFHRVHSRIEPLNDAVNLRDIEPTASKH